jgi:hypothetical protein
MRRNRLITILAALLVALLSLPAFAQASGEDVIRDCNEDGSLDGNYTQEELRDAEQNLPSDIDQYGDCRDVINQAQADGSRNNNAGGGGGGSGAGGAGGQSRRGGSAKPAQGNPALETDSGAYANTKEDKDAYDKAVADATRGGALPGGLAIPAAGDFKPANSDGLPLPLLLALVSIGLLVAVSTVLVARKRLPALSRVTSRFRRS